MRLEQVHDIERTLRGIRFNLPAGPVRDARRRPTTGTWFRAVVAALALLLLLVTFWSAMLSLGGR